MDVSDALRGGLEIARDWGLPLMIALAAVGVISMALIQAVKDVVPIHAMFHRRHIRAWLGPANGPAYKQLLELATGDDERALVGLQVSGLMAQISMASRIALLFPRTFRQLLERLVASNEGRMMIRTICEGQAPAELEEARVRLGHLVERTIDAKQVAIAHDWEWWNKVAGFVVSITVTIVAFLSYFRIDPARGELSWWLAFSVFPLSIVAGFIAPVAKDLVKALESLGKK